MWPVYGGQNGPKSIVSVVPKAELQTPLGLFGQSQRDCPKSPRGVHSSALGATETMLFGPICAPNSGKIHAQSVASTLFGQSLKANSRKFAVASSPARGRSYPIWTGGEPRKAASGRSYATGLARIRSKPLRLATPQLRREIPRGRVPVPKRQWYYPYLSPRKPLESILAPLRSHMEDTSLLMAYTATYGGQARVYTNRRCPHTRYV